MKFRGRKRKGREGKAGGKGRSEGGGGKNGGKR
jgi:hypothetical protein